MPGLSSSEDRSSDGQHKGAFVALLALGYCPGLLRFCASAENKNVLCIEPRQVDPPAPPARETKIVGSAWLLPGPLHKGQNRTQTFITTTMLVPAWLLGGA